MMIVDPEPVWRNYLMNEMLADMVLKSAIRSDDEKTKARDFLNESFIHAESTDIFINLTSIPDDKKYATIVDHLPPPHLTIVVEGATPARIRNINQRLSKNGIFHKIIRVKGNEKNSLVALVFSSLEDKAMGVLAL